MTRLDNDLSPAENGARTFWGDFRSRVVSGLFLALPIVITFWIIYWIYHTLRLYLLDPIARFIQYLRSTGTLESPPQWWDDYAAPVVALLLVLIFLYLLGLLVQSRLSQLIDSVLLRVPLVTTIYAAVRNLFAALDRQRQQTSQFKRVVLVEFPQPGMRSLGIVTNTLHDATTGRSIVCVCVLTGVMPPTGFTLFVPEESVTDLPWSVNEMIQAIVSGGITVPQTIDYFPKPAERPAVAEGPGS
jgi:uncharacterized membrane protein